MKFKIEITEEMGGFMTVEAKSKKDAERKALQHVDDYGMNSANGVDVKVVHREVLILG